MCNLTFDIKTHEDFYQKLLKEYNEFLGDKISSTLALNCVITAWHLVEWVFDSKSNYSVESKEYKQGLSKYLDCVKIECPSLQVMRDLANGTKHCVLENTPKYIKNTELHKGAYGSSYSRSYNISTLNNRTLKREKSLF